MPRLADGESVEQPLDGEQPSGDHNREQPAEHSEHREQRQLPEAAEPVGGHGEQGTVAEEQGMDPTRPARRHHERDQGPGGELDQQQLDGEHDGREGGAEGGGHAGCGPAGQQDLALVGGDVQDLAGERAEGAAGDDDRSLRAEGPAGADRHRGRDRFGHGRAWHHLAAPGENGVPGLGDAVAADHG